MLSKNEPKGIQVPGAQTAETEEIDVEKVKQESYDKFKRQFILEKVIPYAEKYDYTKFSDNDFITGLRNIKEAYHFENDTFNVDIDSFSIQELEPLWKMVDGYLNRRLSARDKQANLVESEKITSGKWVYLPDGRLVAKAKNPCVLGGVHGDETTLPKDMEKALASQRAPVMSLDEKLGYSNWQVNTPAYELHVRGLPMSDMNRTGIADEGTRQQKETVIQAMGQYGEPFLLDCHNDRNVTDPIAYIADIGDVEHKISLAAELGLSRVIIVSAEAMTGSMVESLRAIKPNSDGMTVEVSSTDTSGTSAKIALRFLQMSTVLNNHRPSAGVQILYEFQTTFLPPQTDLKVFKMELISEDQLGLNETAHYTVIDGKPFKITNVQNIPLTEEDKKLF
ncbi:MAG: hypothetical protein WCV88_06030 [Patescibacteria group bacterium]